MKKFVAALGFTLITSSASAATQQPKLAPLMSCGEVSAPAARFIKIYSSASGVTLVENDRAAIQGEYQNGVFTFQQGDFQDKNFLSLEIVRVNGRYVGVMYEPAIDGPTAYKETYFGCAEIIHGGATSNGG